MTGRQRELRELVTPAADPDVGPWLAALLDARRRTLDELDTVDPGMVDRRAHPRLGTIGDLLYHIGLIEADWLLADILGLPTEAWPAWLEVEFPQDVRDERGRLAAVPPQPLNRHLERLARVRELLLERLGSMSAADLATPRSQPEYDVTPAYALHHLLQHEAEHRAHIALIRDALA